MDAWCFDGGSVNLKKGLINLCTTILLKKVQCPLLTSVCMLQASSLPRKFFYHGVELGVKDN